MHLTLGCLEPGSLSACLTVVMGNFDLGQRSGANNVGVSGHLGLSCWVSAQTSFPLLITEAADSKGPFIESSQGRKPEGEQGCREEQVR